MPYTTEHKARTRERIVLSARSMFNRRGFDSVSIEDIMSHAGLTRGGFYNHFASKTDLFIEAVTSYISDSPMHRRMRESKKPMPAAAVFARRLVDLYLSDEVLANPDDHCPLYALPSDAMHAGARSRDAYTSVVHSLEGAFRAAFATSDRDAARKAQQIVSLCVGGMVLARTTNDSALGKSIRSASRRQALALLEQD
jgi:AcrR family transcriptional regulator